MDGEKTLIDRVLTDHHQIDSTKVAAATYVKTRARILRNSQRALINIYSLKDWTFKYVEDATVTVLANTYTAALPAAWANEGEQGNVWRPSTNPGPLAWLRSGELEGLIQTQPDVRRLPEAYTVVGLYTLKVWPADTQNRTLGVRYTKVPDTLTDATPGGLVAALPDRWHELLYEMVVQKEMQNKGDVQSMPSQSAWIARMQYDMICEEAQGKPWERNMPRFAGSADVSEIGW